ncbi:malonate decarboxylase holo-[acyl-carrier-protein] synthase [Breoghania sp.]|uniref:malonate decarboxylase holo-[acyl-carrier-protein] synthase n=1 Tax=Breoghania sp. TaxID=2065378 RepID=UPI002AABFB94|nr:malonate decarboxylase holo-[acyl-carrier-protein] synthase [Breoghania sp.]
MDQGTLIMLNRRHVLAQLSSQTREALVPALLDGLPHTMRDDETEKAVLKGFLEDRIPGIVCRPTRECGEGQGQLGFSFPFRVGEQRVRSSLIVNADEVTAYVTPYEVMDRAMRRFPTAHPRLQALSDCAEQHSVRLGLIGSAALAAVTGLAYVRPQSDIDVVVDARHGGSLEAFNDAVAALCEELGISVDAELEVNDSLGVKMKEYFSSAKKVLVKYIDGIDLVEKEKLPIYKDAAMLNNKATLEYNRGIL